MVIASKLTSQEKENAMAIRDEILDELLKEYERPDDLLGRDGIIAELKKRLIERAMEGEMNAHLGYKKHSSDGNNSGNSRNGHGRKKVQTNGEKIDISVPRDRSGKFEPEIIPKHHRRFDGFDEKIISMYGLGMSTREIQSHLKEIYNVEVSPTLISQVTEEVMEDVKAWRNRLLDPVYPVVYLDCLVVKCRDNGAIVNKSVYLALGINLEGKKELLGMWIAGSEGAKFWLNVVTELKNRGLQDIFIACVDGLKGFPEAINSVYPDAEVQLCIVHMIRHSLKFVSYKDRKQLAADLKTVYGSLTLESAEENLENFAQTWDNKYPTISKSWRNNWTGIVPFFAFPADIRKAIYTTNAIESLNRSLRKVLKTKGVFPNDDAIMKQLYLALHRISQRWTMPIRNWKGALNQFAVKYEGRMDL
jgi:transposase-like protein